MAMVLGGRVEGVLTFRPLRPGDEPRTKEDDLRRTAALPWHGRCRGMAVLSEHSGCAFPACRFPPVARASRALAGSIPRSLPQGRGRHAGEGLSAMAQRPVPYPVSSRARVPRHTRNVRSTEFANEPCHHFPHGADDTLSYVRRGGYRGRAAR